MATKKAKVISAKFLKEFRTKYGTNYEHQIIFDNGDTGKYVSKSQDQKKFVIGQETEYDISTNTREWQGKEYTDTIIKPITDDNRSGGGNYKQKELDPKVQMRIAKMVTMECALDFLLNTDYDRIKKGYDYAIAKVFLTWMIGKGLDKEHGQIASNSLRMAIKGMVIKSIRFEEEQAYDSIIKKADEYFNYYTTE